MTETTSAVPRDAVAALRPMRVEDAPAIDDLTLALWGGDDTEPARVRRARGLGRIVHLVDTDPGGAWVAEVAGGLAGAVLAIERDGVWGLSLLVVAPDLQGRGIGRRLLGAALAYGSGARGGLILSSEHPAAMRRYARAGFALQPCVSAAGVVAQDHVPDEAASIEDAGEAGIATADAVGRAVRGAGHGRDLPQVLAHGARLLVLDDRAFAVTTHGGTRISMLGALDEAAARTVLWAALARVPAGATVHVDFLTAAQQWAIPAVLDAGLALSPDGPLFVRGAPGPLAPYIPSGAYL
jgi:GNAT superfamily N-acetyltransferase